MCVAFLTALEIIDNAAREKLPLPKLSSSGLAA